MELIIFISFLIILALTIYIFYDKGNSKIVNEEFCNLPSVNDTHALEAPNIPDDWRCKFKIGGKYCRKNKYNLAPKCGKFEFPKPE